MENFHIPKSHSEPNLFTQNSEKFHPYREEVSVSEKRLMVENELIENFFTQEESKSVVEESLQLPHRNIVIALDKSKLSEDVLRFAIENLIDFSIHSRDLINLVSVVSLDPEMNFDGKQQEINKSLRKKKDKAIELRRKQMSKYENICQHYQVAYRTKLLLDFGKKNPGVDIVRYSREVKSPLVVLGSRGYGHVRQFLYKSVSKYCMDRCKCPVLIVRE